MIVFGLPVLILGGILAYECLVYTEGYFITIHVSTRDDAYWRLWLPRPVEPMTLETKGVIFSMTPQQTLLGEYSDILGAGPVRLQYTYRRAVFSIGPVDPDPEYLRISGSAGGPPWIRRATGRDLDQWAAIVVDIYWSYLAERLSGVVVVFGSGYNGEVAPGWTMIYEEYHGDYWIPNIQWVREDLRWLGTCDAVGMLAAGTGFTVAGFVPRKRGRRTPGG